jgi:hypothetical protein
MATRRRHGEDGISFEHRGGPCRDLGRHRNCPGLWRGEITLGYTGDSKRTRRGGGPRPPGSPSRHHAGPGRSGRCAAWLALRIALQCWWQAWSTVPSPRQFQALMTSLEAGHGLHLYIPS